MEENSFRVTGGKRKHDKMTKELFENNRTVYEGAKLKIWVYMLKQGEKPTKWYKPNKQGTKVAFEFMENQQEADKSVEELKNHITRLNEEIGTDFNLIPQNK
ncbi:hypothetical protein [Pontibacillus salipaludis]|uniref:Uncharacterized protein n=1 Tax=Pontibacillus salipaludis TaxID=1697394 RepID=A0ABQ1PWR6_9BACI|nr:hypothetical protein [Pontibacillus salipaludis]GGD05223.1 hypothetical protein GCM10011389_10920 [Pontibacillus salipaludis]